MRCRLPLIAASAVAAVSLLAAGCGGAGSSGVASVRSSTTTATTTAQTGAVAYAHCMRSDGVLNFPDPDSSGEFAGIQVKRVGPEVSLARLHAATRACQHLVPNGIVPLAGLAITAAHQADYLRAAACMRSHGFPGFPDPAFHNGVGLTMPSSINQNSPQFQSAAMSCRRLIPRGLPWAGPSGT
ncbi:MAG: hypothetical protein ACRDLP_10060 [Solirubrobacteraceae bacterium]